MPCLIPQFPKPGSVSCRAFGTYGGKFQGADDDNNIGDRVNLPERITDEAHPGSVMMHSGEAGPVIPLEIRIRPQAIMEDARG